MRWALCRSTIVNFPWRLAIAVTIGLFAIPDRAEATCGDYLQHSLGHTASVENSTDGNPFPATLPLTCSGGACRQLPGQMPLEPPDLNLRWNSAAKSLQRMLGEDIRLSHESGFPLPGDQIVGACQFAHRLERPPQLVALTS